MDELEELPMPAGRAICDAAIFSSSSCTGLFEPIEMGGGMIKARWLAV